MLKGLTMQCLGCGYDLRGLPESRCPECARPFDPSDPATYTRNARATRWARTCLAVCSAHCALLAVFTLDLGTRVPGYFYLFGTTRHDCFGACLVLSSLPTAIAALLFARGKTGIAVAIADLVLAAIWLLSLVRVLRYL